ncbi:DUF2513 domain-containing protein (plasmid) [Rhizobium sp. CB3171]|uniref:DUF2513 domain-containing protein n=1 Tax=Rhizobium sp. CB3171 TaxID=3039157 RepID=UPI0024B19305|nr:DUF2513 domain-containing protein [Rhizobium sp. CB3171]WFU07524.1 DUF2513 domain-containing protein [Rhizobium sp. CB3171]
MKRDMNLIRELLLRLEARDLPSGAVWFVDAGDELMQIEGYSRQQIDQHIALIGRSGFVDTGSSNPNYGIGFKGLTWEGHDFVDSVRDQDIWDKTQKGMKDVGGFTFDLVKDLAKGFIKQKIKQHTGVEL